MSTALVIAIALAAQVSLTWDMPTENIDGTPLTDLCGAKIYYGHSSSNYTVVVDVGMTNACTITNLEPGVLYYFNGTAYYTTSQIESAFTDEVAKIATVHPSPPVHLLIGDHE